ncbi:hypothetical protein HELRODRAFT_74104 [Helobdella robusta]|uniref:C3H1-type domain-containing protein n=1 Tax=Helobdella robusta TaxID=6412 RepID=T1G1M4_HELRO|nr:hypothetical protein HELRODRAFT_74104 [Helobdella robusta]ESO09045.1 hypothetical protein HELRODRAFT_74104 [Helobdella robusta]
MNVNIVNKDRYKTELCRKFMENSSCPYSKKCQFAHGYHELKPVTRHPRYRTELCREYFNHGLCTYGTRCNFIHQLPGEEDKKETKDLNSVGKADDDANDDNLLGGISNVEGCNERPYTPSNDSGQRIKIFQLLGLTAHFEKL